MLSLETAREEWAERSRVRSLEPVMTLAKDGLVLGATVLTKLRSDAGGLPLLAIDGSEERVLALLAAAYRRPIGPAVLDNIRRAAAEWRRGEICLAQIHLARSELLGLPDREEASFRLYLSDKLLADGVPPHELIKACGIDPAPLGLLKSGYNPNQPRVPAGNPDGGEWTSADASPVTSDPTDPMVQLINYTPVHGCRRTPRWSRRWMECRSKTNIQFRQPIC